MKKFSVVHLAVICLIVIALFTTAALYAQQPTPSATPAPASKVVTYKANEVQLLKLENLQLKAKLAQVPAQQAQEKFQESLRALFAEANQIVKANKWPEGTTVNPDNLEFTYMPPPPPAKPAAETPAANEGKK